MALGNTSINRLSDLNQEIIDAIQFGNETGNCMYSTFDSFRYVIEHLRVWADETTIGADMLQRLTTLSKNLYDLMVQTNKLNNDVKDFISNQKRLNGGPASPLFD